MWKHRIYVFAFFVLIFSVIPFDLFVAPQLNLPTDMFFRIEPIRVTWEGMLRGDDAGTDVEANLMRRSYVTHSIAALYRQAWYQFTGRTNALVTAGEDKWLFQSADLRELPKRTVAQARRGVVPRLIEARDTLKEAGVELVVVLIPDRARVRPDAVAPGYELPRDRRALWGELIAAAREAGVRVIDLAEVYSQTVPVKGDFFYRDDFHWTSYGIEVACNATSKVVSTLIDESESAGVDMPVKWVMDFQRPLMYELTLLGFLSESKLNKTFLDNAPRATFPKSPEPRVDRFIFAPVMVFGTSFADIGSSELLSRALNRPVGRLSRIGKDPMLSLAWIVAGGANRSQPIPRIAVLEVNEWQLNHELPREYRLPRYDIRARATQPVHLERVRGVRIEGSTLVPTLRRMQFKVCLQKPASDLRLFIETPMLWLPHNEIRCLDSDELPLHIVDNIGPVAYDFRREEPSAEWQFEIALSNTDNPITVSEVATLSGG